MPRSPADSPERIPATLGQPAAARFWTAVVFTGVSTGLAAIVLTRLLEWVQRLAWGGSGADLLNAAQGTAAVRHVVILICAGVLTGLGQLLLRRLSSGNGIDTTTAIWFQAGRVPAIRTLGSAVLSVIIVGLGASLGREGAPKQAGAVFANLLSDGLGLSDEQRTLLVACGSGSGMAAAYGVPLGGALFSLEVMRGVLGLRYVLPALFASLIATAVSWLGLKSGPTYAIPVYPGTPPAMLWALVIGLFAGLASVLYVRTIAWADRTKPSGASRLVAPVVVLGLLGLLSVPFPQLLGNGRDVSQLAFRGELAGGLALALFLLKPMATVLCIRSGAPGGLFTPSLTVGAMLGAALGHVAAHFGAGAPAGLCALLGAAAVEAATTQGPFSTAVLFIELTGQAGSFILPMLLAIGGATLVSRTIELRSVYEARLTDEQVQQRRQVREEK